MPEAQGRDDRPWAERTFEGALVEAAGSSPARISRYGLNPRESGSPTQWRGVLHAAAADATRAIKDALTLEAERGTAVLFVPVFLAAGAFLYFGLPNEPAGLHIVALAAAASVAAFFSPPRKTWRPAVLAILFVCLGALLAKVETWRMGTMILGSEVATRVTGRIVAMDRFPNGRARLTIDVVSTERPKLRYTPQRIRATARKLPAGTIVGSTISGLVRLRPPSGPVRPDSYDFSFDSYFDGIGASGFFMGRLALLDAPQPGAASAFMAAIENARDRIASRVRERIGGAEGEIGAALMVGARAGIPVDISEALRRSGLYHVISISGLHMALVAGVVIGALRSGLALFPAFASRRPVRKYAAAAGLAAIAAYMLISGGEVAAQRSFLMLAVMLTALLFDRAALTMRNLAISAVVVIVATPHEVVGPSFQMSFAATAALVAAYAWWTDRRKTIAAPVPARSSFPTAVLRGAVKLVAGLLVTSLVAGFATTIYSAYHFQRIAPLSLVSNLVAMPFVSAVVMPSAVLAAVAMPFGLDGPFLDLMGLGLSAMIAVSEWFSRHSPIDAVGLVSGRSVLLITFALIVATFASTWLRLAAIPFVLAGVLSIAAVRAPDVLISEDGALVGFLTPDGKLAVNVTRPDAFTASNWRRALRADDIRKPQEFAGARSDGRVGSAEQSGPGMSANQTAAPDAVDATPSASPEIVVPHQEPGSGPTGKADSADGPNDTNQSQAATGRTTVPSTFNRLSPVAVQAGLEADRPIVNPDAFPRKKSRKSGGRNDRDEAPASASQAPTGPKIGGRMSDAEASADPGVDASGQDLEINQTEISGKSGTDPGTGFRCDEVACVARLPSGATIVRTADARLARRACERAALIVLDDATTASKCPDGAMVVTLRELARFGSAAVYLPTTSANGTAEIRFSIGTPDRPWQSHRVFSREARGLPPRQPTKAHASPLPDHAIRRKPQ